MSIYRGAGGSGTTADTAAINEIIINTEAAQTSADNASASEVSAAFSASSAATSATAAATSATTANNAAGNAASSASAASTSATNAATSATAAATSETNAASSAANAATSASNAATSETNAATSATAAQSAQTSAETAQTAAEAAQASTENIFTQFGDQYLGTKASDPALDNSGNSLTEGDVYWNSTDNVLKFYSGSAWVAPEDIATTAATNASTSATSAANSATAAATSASNAATSETNAQTYATAFLNSEAYNITVTDTTNWDTAYGWGNHASAGYLVSSDIANMLETADIGVSVQAYDANTAKTDTAQTFSAAQRGATQTASISGSTVLDFASYQNFVLTLTGATTLANPSTESIGQSGFITFIQDGTGSRTVSLGTDYETATGAGITLSTDASSTDIVPYVVIASGRILLGNPQKAFS